MPKQLPQTDLPSLNTLRAATSPEGVPSFRVGILIGPGFIPMDMIGVQTVFGLLPGVEIHLLWKTSELVEGFPSWWTQPTTTFADCPKLDVIAVPMLPPEIQNDLRVQTWSRRTLRDRHLQWSSAPGRSRPSQGQASHNQSQLALDPRPIGSV